MLRRVLPVVAGATAVLFVPSTASATPPPAPVENHVGGWGFSGYAQRVPLPDGRIAAVYLNEYRPGAGAPAVGWLGVELWTDYPCLEYPFPEPGSDVEPEPRPGICQGGWVSGSVELTDDQVHFDRSLRTASVEAQVEIPVSDWVPPAEDDGSGDPEWTDPGEGEWTDPGEGEWTDPGEGWTDPGEGEWTEPGEEFPPYEAEMTTVTLRLEFTGTGPLDTQGTHGTVCGDGERECQSIRIYASRDASVTVTLDGVQAAAVPALLNGIKGLDTAAPKFTYPL